MNKRHLVRAVAEPDVFSFLERIYFSVASTALSM
jgi:hypothetical protein